ncbi:hypothetical protein POL68_36940 [Stigmatella sp. ncwal1]|uniref:Uncharacterized protein n=1 Tax=Stigmatella ashevillensis TaxID=2995309 RepID=A0ABT5DKQ4_9BACT|nr:hypothetical protein [Stigmatella ashevillena]MDC0714111.1 hypothetical protein [Stigmatella ashevillena]
MQNSMIKGRGVDAAPEQRPGVPMETEPQPLAGAQSPIAQQHADVPVFKHGGRARMPPVYGTAIPPKGMSGVVRKLAYHYPDHWTRHWMMLLAADRMDVWEHRILRFLPAGLAVVSVAAIGGLTWKLSRR